jgi:hypothetical protein
MPCSNSIIVRLLKDDFKVSKRLTLNLGVRYDLYQSTI